MKDFPKVVGRQARIAPRIEAAYSSVCSKLCESVAELPYEWLFTASAQPVLIAETRTGTIIDANPAAARLLATSRTALIGHPLRDSFAAQSAQALGAQLEATAVHSHPVELSVSALTGGAEMIARFSTFQVASSSVVLVHLAAQMAESIDQELVQTPSVVMATIENASMGFVITDPVLRVEYANQYFIDLVRLNSVEALRGRSITRWIDLSAADLAQLGEQKARREAVTRLTTRLRPKLEKARLLEIRAVCVLDGKNACWGFSIHARPRVN